MIVTAHNRRDYLPQAIQSIQSQEGLRPGDVEVVVSKNFEDPAVDRSISSAGYLGILYSDAPAGKQILEAIESCHAPLIALLDDDDRWHPRKLSIALARFATIPDLQYYGHGLRPIDSSGSVSTGTLRRSQEFYRKLEDGTAIKVDPKAADGAFIDWLFANNPGCNSAIVARREIYEDFRSYLRRVRTSIDHFLLSAALLRPAPLLIEHLPLTDWRVHSQNRSRFQLDTLPEFLADLQETCARLGQDNQVFLDMVGKTGNPELATYLEDKVALIHRLLSIARGQANRVESVRGVLSHLREFARRDHRSYWSRADAISASVQAVSTELAQTLLYLYLQNESKR